MGDGTVLGSSGSGNSQELKITSVKSVWKKVLASIAPIEKSHDEGRLKPDLSSRGTRNLVIKVEGI